MNAIHWLLNIIRNPGDVITGFGYIGMLAIIFIETAGLFPILPGDSLLVVAGIYSARGVLNLGWLLLILIPAAVAGDAVAYLIGKKLGPKLFSRPRSRFFKPEYAQKAHEFYERHGGSAIIIARFVPIVRTYVPVVAGVAQMPYKRFGLFNIIGGAAWVTSMLLIGFFAGEFARAQGFPLEKHIEKVIIVVVFLSLLPGILSYLKNRRAGA
jgi:membrane-associated protein